MRENNLRAQKVSKLQQLNAEGVSGYGYRFERTHYADQIAEYFGALETGEECEQQVRLCGRIMRQRNTWMFVELEDETGTIQLFCHKTNLNADMMKQLRLLDRGDLIGVYGQPMRTAHGELSIKVTRWELMAKSIQPIPDNADVLKDPEARYRNRHLDLMLNKEAREIFRKRSSTISCMRQYLDRRGFLEFETPILEVQAGGAEARPFTTHHNALDIDMHLRIAPELHLRRLLVGGFEKVYEIGRNFRNEGLSTRHNPEFTSIELYQAYCDYYQLMDLTEDMLRHIVSTVCGKSRISYQGVEIDFGSPFARISMTEAIENECGVDVDAIKDVEQMKMVAKQLGVKLTDEDSCGEIINTIFEKRVEKTLIQPTFIIDYPVEVSVCQQLHRVRDGYVERFELFVFGRELGNACSELNDPFEQKRRFDAQSRKRDKGHEEIPAPDLEFLHVMEYGMPPMMGLGIGIDRLVMFITDSPSIRDVIAFPTMKPIQESKQVPLVVGATPCVALPPAS